MAIVNVARNLLTLRIFVSNEDDGCQLAIAD